MITAVTASFIAVSKVGQSPAHNGPSAVGLSCRPLMNAWLFSGGVKVRNASIASWLWRLGMLAPSSLIGACVSADQRRQLEALAEQAGG